MILYVAYTAHGHRDQRSRRYTFYKTNNSCCVYRHTHTNTQTFTQTLATIVYPPGARRALNLLRWRCARRGVNERMTTDRTHGVVPKYGNLAPPPRILLTVAMCAARRRRLSCTRPGRRRRFVSGLLRTNIDVWQRTSI